MNRFRSDFRYCAPAVRCSTIDGGIANLSEPMSISMIAWRLALTIVSTRMKVLTRGKRAYGAS